MTKKNRTKDAGKSEEVQIKGSLQRGKVKARIVAKWRDLPEKKICLLLLFLMLLLNLLVLVIALVISRPDVPSVVSTIVSGVVGFFMCAALSYWFVHLAGKLLVPDLARAEARSRPEG